MGGVYRGLGLAILLGAANAGCAGLDRNDQGPLQPQSVSGSCQVGHFFLLAQTACSFVVINPDLQAFPTASLISTAPRHGQAVTGLTNGGRSVGVSYTPAPGYVGPDQFTVTIEPNDHAIAVAVAAQ